MQDSAVIYCRVSSLKQVKEGNGLGSQEQRCRNYAKQMGWNVIGVFKDEGVSGAKLHRPGIDQMVGFLRKRNDRTFVVLDDYKRFARDLVVYMTLKEELKGIGCKIVSPTGNFDESPEGEALEQVQAVFSELERKQNARQVKNRMKARLEQGYYVLGGCPFGYRPNSTLGIKEPYEPATKVVKEALEGYAYGTLSSFEDVSRYINARHLTIYNGKELKFDGDRAALLLKGAWFHAGYVQNIPWEVSRRPGKHKAIITNDTLEMIELRLNKKPIPKYRKGLSQSFPLRGYVHCACCEGRLTAGYSGGRDKKYGYYTCKNGGCDMYNKNFRMEKIHDEFEGLLQSIESPSSLVDWALAILVDQWEEYKASQKKQSLIHQTELREVERQIQTLLTEVTLANSSAVKKTMHDRIEELITKKENLQFRVKNIVMDETDFKTVTNVVSGLLKSPWNVWKESALPRKHLIQQLIFPRGLTLEKDKKFRKPAKGLPFGFLGGLMTGKPELVDPIGCETVRPVIIEIIRFCIHDVMPSVPDLCTNT